jgi:hypothetical protein
VVNGKRAVTNMYNSPHAVTRIDWWEASEALLQMKLSDVLDANFESEKFFGVTPALLSKDIVTGIGARISKLYDTTNWIDWLFEHGDSGFTEYCLYGVYAVVSGKFAEYHIPMNSGIYNHPHSVFWKDQFSTLNLHKMATMGHFYPGHFVVVQSNTGITANEVKKLMGFAFDTPI